MLRLHVTSFVFGYLKHALASDSRLERGKPSPPPPPCFQKSAQISRVAPVQILIKGRLSLEGGGVWRREGVGVIHLLQVYYVRRRVLGTHRRGVLERGDESPYFQGVQKQQHLPSGRVFLDKVLANVHFVHVTLRLERARRGSISQGIAFFPSSQSQYVKKCHGKTFLF